VTDFILIPSRPPDVPGLLTARAIGFAQSEDYLELAEAERGLPSAVIAAFSRYVAGLLAAMPQSSELTSCVDAMEELASWRDDEVDNLIQVDIIEVLDPDVLAILVARLGPNARLVWEDWVKRNARVNPYLDLGQ